MKVKGYSILIYRFEIMQQRIYKGEFKGLSLNNRC